MSDWFDPLNTFAVGFVSGAASLWIAVVIALWRARRTPMSDNLEELMDIVLGTLESHEYDLTPADEAGLVYIVDWDSKVVDHPVTITFSEARR